MNSRNLTNISDAVSITCQLRSYAINTAAIYEITKVVRSNLGLESFHIGLSFVGSRAIRSLNRQFRGYDKVTDVLSFPQVDWPKPVPFRKKTNASKSRVKSAVPNLLGDIVISIPVAARNAKNIGQTLERELCFLIVHGFLHLCGYDHIVKKDESRMLKAQRHLMQQLESGGRRPLWSNCVKAVVRRRK